MRGFTEAAAKEWAQYGIRVNGTHAVLGRTRAMRADGLSPLAYGPGIVDTPMWDHIDRELARIVCRSLCFPSTSF